MSRSWLILLLFVFGFGVLYAQDQKKVQFALSIKPLYAQVFIHSNSLDTFSGASGRGVQLDLNRYRLDDKAYAYAHRHYNSGFGLQYIKFSHTGLGEALSLSYFMEPFLIERDVFSVRMRCAGGITLASNPYDETNNPINKAYSSYLSGYLGLGFSAWFQVNPKTRLFLDATYSHFSNGNTNNPNAGLNYPNLGLGIEYQIKETQKPLGKLFFYDERWRYDGAVFICNKSLPFYPKERFWTYGAYVQTSYRTNQINAWTIGLEAYVDQCMRMAMDSSEEYASQNLDNKLLGLLAGHEFLFNRCIFSQQLGVYLYKEVPGELINRVYHRWGFNYKLSKHWMLGVNLNANLQKAFIFDGRIIYSWYRKR